MINGVGLFAPSLRPRVEFDPEVLTGHIARVTAAISAAAAGAVAYTLEGRRHEVAAISLDGNPDSGGGGRRDRAHRARARVRGTLGGRGREDSSVDGRGRAVLLVLRRAVRAARDRGHVRVRLAALRRARLPVVRRRNPARRAPGVPAIAFRGSGRAGAPCAAGRACCTPRRRSPVSRGRVPGPRATRASCRSSRRNRRSRRGRCCSNASTRAANPASSKIGPIATSPCSTRNSRSVSVSAPSICARVMPARSNAARLHHEGGRAGGKWKWHGRTLAFGQCTRQRGST